MPRGSKLPRFHAQDIESTELLVSKLNAFITTLEQRLITLEGPLVDPREPAVGEETYTVTNATEQRAFDADTVTLAELADILGTFFTDLHNEEKLR